MTLPVANHASWSSVLLLAVFLATSLAAASFVLLQGGPASVDAAESTKAGKAAAAIDLQFKDATGKARTLAEFRGKALLVNLWATWCVPCRKEMPALDRLQATRGGPDFQVVVLSLDRGGPDVVSTFFTEIGIANLDIYVVDMAAVRSAVGLFGLPTTLLVDRDGREVSRVVGPAEWDSPEKIADIRRQLALPELPARPPK
jgi:thiol-disulfide isomerase/thioredoxin